MKRVPIQSVLFKKYTAPSWAELEAFASEFRFKIVDRYYTYDREAKSHIPAIEVV